MHNIQEHLLEMYPKGGYFVEAGAHDGVGDSQTLILEKHGWKGLCIEPSSAWNGLCRSRSCTCSHVVLWDKDGEELTFREVKGNAIELSGILSSFSDHWDRTTRQHKDMKRKGCKLSTTLSAACAPAVIEFLCLDTEGSEGIILSTHDFDRYRFLNILVEHNNSPNKTTLFNLLHNKGYGLIEDDGTNFLMEYAPHD